MSATAEAGIDDAALLEALRAGDEASFEALVCRHHRALFTLARSYVRSETVAEEIVQETWLGVLRGLDRFEGRSSLKTWIFSVLINQARARGRLEQRTASTSLDEGPAGDGPAEDPGRFVPPGDAFEGYWVTAPRCFGHLPEEQVTSTETLEAVAEAIRGLPARQREVITLRDVEGWSAEEVCASLGLSEANQRVLLHRARVRVRSILEGHFAAEGAS